MNSASRYLRQSILSGVGSEGQQKIASGRVLVIGAGGLGCPALQYLATAGVGHLTILDDDLVDVTNLGRQILFLESDVGRPKCDAARDRLLALNPHIQIQAFRERFSASNAEHWVLQHDVILDGSDNFATKFLVNDACVMYGKPFSHAGVLRWEGQLLTYVPGSPCYRCLFEEPPPADEVPNCSEVGTLGPLAGAIGCLQAVEVLKLLLNHEGVLSGGLITLDAALMKTRKIQFSKNPQCPICGETPRITKLQEEGVAQCDLRQQDGQIWLFTFEGHERVIKAERLLKKNGYSVEPKVTPRQMSNECGICLEAQCEDIQKLLQTLHERGPLPLRYGRRSDFLSDFAPHF
jgi:molybdopterin-synthase adenylyltransferase